jgi:hypothetical protein
MLRTRSSRAISASRVSVGRLFAGRKHPNQLRQFAGLNARQLQPQLRTSRRFHFDQTGRPRGVAGCEQLHECWQSIRALFRWGFSPSRLRRGWIETPGPFPQARTIHIQCPCGGIDPIALRAYFAVPPIAAAPALCHADKAPFPVPYRRRASYPWHTLALNNDRAVTQACRKLTNESAAIRERV